MNKMIEKFVKQEFFSEEEGEYIDSAIKRKESIVVSGHRSAGVRPLLASLMAAAKKSFECQQVKGFDDLETDADFFLIPGIDGIDFEKLISEAAAKEDTAVITIKEPEHPISLMKILRMNSKEDKSLGKKFHTLDCKKENDVPYLDKITEIKLDENGKLHRQIFESK
ncbi:MAG: hypothetical protein ACQESS_09515 [Bacillota bacterium]